MEDKKKNGSMLKFTIIAVLLAAMILIYFNHLSNKSSEQRTEKETTEIDQLSNYNMVDDYPKTPRDVVKLHNRYLKLFYSKKLTDDELVILNQQTRYLYSGELLKFNDENTTLNDLKKNINKMKEEGYTYKLCELPEASQIKLYTRDGKEMATLEVTITVEMEDSMGYMYEQYVLVKENGQWKILAWGDSKFGQHSSEQ